jgi:hypothetical protein
VLDGSGDVDPGVLALLVDGEPRRECAGIFERAERDGDDVGHVSETVVQRRSTVRAEVMDHAVAAVGDAHVFARAARYAHVLPGESHLGAEGAAGSALASEAMTHGYACRLAAGFEPELSAGAPGVMHSFVFGGVHDYLTGERCCPEIYNGPADALWWVRFPRASSCRYRS